MKRLLTVVPSGVMALGLLLAPLPVLAAAALTPAPAPAGAATPPVACAQPGSGAVITDPISAGAACSKGGSQKVSLFGQGGIFTVIANTLIFVVGAISVIYIIVGGLRYVTSRGDTKVVQSAKDTILYSVVGIVVAMISFALVQFVVNALNTAK